MSQHAPNRTVMYGSRPAEEGAGRCRGSVVAAGTHMIRPSLSHQPALHSESSGTNPSGRSRHWRREAGLRAMRGTRQSIGGSARQHGGRPLAQSTPAKGGSPQQPGRRSGSPRSCRGMIRSAPRNQLTATELPRATRSRTESINLLRPSNPGVIPSPRHQSINVHPPAPKSCSWPPGQR
jgi:hypothetical protein